MKKILLFTCACLLWACEPASTLKPVLLNCEYMTAPPVVDVAEPRLSWINLAGEGIRGEEQTAWQIRVASSREELRHADLWDSGKQRSDKSTRISYEGSKLKSGQECWWQVRIWNLKDQVSDWSEPGWWRMGILHQEEWKASWIGAPWQDEGHIKKPSYPDKRPEDLGAPAPLLRKEFSVEKDLESAVAFVSGLGYFELRLNGEKVGNDVLVPNQTNYGKRPALPEALINLPDEFQEYKVMYLAYDLKDLLKKGPNALGAILGNGFYNPGKFWAEGYGSPRFLCQLHLVYKDGSSEIVVSDKTWKASKSPILMNMVYWGEDYDARLEQPGWCKPGFDDADWEKVSLRKAPEGKLVAHTAHTDQVTEVIEALSIEKKGEGHYFVDFGLEISGWVHLLGVEGPVGHQIRIVPNANLYSGENHYTFKGDGPEDYAPRFNWFVFSGVDIYNWPGELTKENLRAEMVNTYIEATAEFETSNPLFNQINTIWRRSQIDNMHGGVASDCPHRERSAYTGDGQVACNTVLHNYDARNFYQKWISDMRGAQIPATGYVPNGAPWQPGCGGGPAWGSAICVMPWEFYIQYGSIDMLDDNYEAMKAYVRYMETWTSEEGIMHSQRTGGNGEVLKWFNLGEWVPPGEMIPDALVHTFYLWFNCHITARTAEILGEEKEAQIFTEKANRISMAFHSHFFNELTGSYGDAGGNILALRMGVPEARYERALSALKAELLNSEGHLSTGIIGTRFFFEVLAENGLQQEAFEAMNKRTEPGFGRWIELGSTCTREHWDESGSFNHPMFGGGLIWFYRNLAGMQAIPEEAGYRQIIFRPQPVENLDYVKYSNLTPYGRAGIEWRNSREFFQMDVEVPVGSFAMVHVPTPNPDRVREGGVPAKRAQGVEYMGNKGEYSVFQVQSGNYSFVAAH